MILHFYSSDSQKSSNYLIKLRKPQLIYSFLTFSELQSIPISLYHNRDCYANAFRFALFHNSIDYVEGFVLKAGSDYLIHHAWNRFETSYHFDLTYELIDGNKIKLYRYYPFIIIKHRHLEAFMNQYIPFDDPIYQF